MLRWRYLERPKRATLTPTSRRAVLPKTGLAPSLALLLVSPPLRPRPKRILTMTRTLGRMLKTSKPFAGIVPRSLAQNELGNVASAKRTIAPRERSRPLRRRCPRSYSSKTDLARAAKIHPPPLRRCTQNGSGVVRLDVAVPKTGTASFIRFGVSLLCSTRGR